MMVKLGIISPIFGGENTNMFDVRLPATLADPHAQPGRSTEVVPSTREFKAEGFKLCQEDLATNDFCIKVAIYRVIWKILGLFSSPISREIDHP